MDAADTTTMTTSGTTITRMNDKSGNGYNTTVIGGAPALTANAINGLSAISFNGSSYMTGSNANTTATASFFLIATLASGQGAGQQYTSAYCFSRVVAGAACYNEVQSINGLSCQGAATSLALSPQRTNANGPTYTLSNYNTAFMHTTVCNGTTMAGYGNGNSLGTTSSTGNFAITFYNIGSQTSQSPIFYNYNWTGYVGELIAFNNALSDPQRQQVEGYLAQKWGLTAYLPAGHPGLTQTLYNPKVYQSRVPLSLSFAVYYNNPTTFATGCQLWLDAADSTTVTGTTTVTAWRDKSGRGYNLVPGAGTTSYANSGISIATSYLYANGVVDLTTFTLFVVVKNNNSSTNIPLFAARPNTTPSYNSTDGFGFYLDAQAQTRFYGGYPTGGQSITTTGLNTSVASLFSVTGTRDGVFQQWNSGTTGGTATYTTRTSTGQGFSVGGEWGGSSYTTYSSSSTIYEVIVYNTVLTTTQRQSVEGYLTKKWALAASLPAGNLGLTGTYVNPTWEATIPYGVTSTSGIVATGGTIVTANGFRTHTFTTVGTTNFVVSQALQLGVTIQVLIVAGGGSGSGDRAAGGGAGGLIFTNMLVSQGTYPAIVGAGGTVGTGNVHGTDGSNSSFNGQVAIGGGSGGSHYQGNYIGNTGGSGGGGAAPGPGTPSAAGGSGTVGQGFGGGTGFYNGTICSAGGGGGAGAAGSNASTTKGGNGGIGLFITIGGNSAYYAGGGGGAGAQDYGPTVGGTGGLGGGGTAAQSASIAATPGTPNTGGGGAGAGNAGWPGNATNGGSGIVIISYPYP